MNVSRAHLLLLFVVSCLRCRWSLSRIIIGPRRNRAMAQEQPLVPLKNTKQQANHHFVPKTTHLFFSITNKCATYEPYLLIISRGVPDRFGIRVRTSYYLASSCGSNMFASFTRCLFSAPYWRYHIDRKRGRCWPKGIGGGSLPLRSFFSRNVLLCPIEIILLSDDPYPRPPKNTTLYSYHSCRGFRIYHHRVGRKGIFSISTGVALVTTRVCGGA